MPSAYVRHFAQPASAPCAIAFLLPHLRTDLLLPDVLLSEQDRWLQLVGQESGELHVRLAVVPGPPDSAPVQQMVAMFNDLFNRGSTPTLQVSERRASN